MWSANVNDTVSLVIVERWLANNDGVAFSVLPNIADAIARRRRLLWSSYMAVDAKTRTALYPEVMIAV